MNMQKLSQLDLDGNGFKAFDWALSFAVLGYGLYAASAFWIISGFLGCIFSWWRPLGKFQKWFASFLKKRVN